MSDAMSIDAYLAQGGVLSAPSNVPARYRGELMRMMASFVDSELAGSAGFASVINDAPGITQRISAARIVLEKADHAERVLKIMGTFGADMARYAVHHPWATRVDRQTDLAAARHGGDMRLSVFHYPLQGWVDAVTMNAMMGLAANIQLTELSRVSYAPLAEAFRDIAPREARHAELGFDGLVQIAATTTGRNEIVAATAYWRPRVEGTFGSTDVSRFEMQKRLGIRHRPNEVLLREWMDDVASKISRLGLN
jgi:ring-1,2-phenylacetyl-CoA epoxidase subunit PaaA